MAMVLDVTSTNVTNCSDEIFDFCRKHNISLELLFLDMRKRRARVDMPTYWQKALTKRDLNWFGKPKQGTVDKIVAKPVDLYICLSNSDMWFVKYLSVCAKARFKIGRKAYEGDPYNFVVETPADYAEGPVDITDISAVFNTIEDFLGKIK